MKKQIKSVISLFSICAVIAVILAITNALTAPKIKENEDNATNAALLEVLPSGKNFKSVDISTNSEIPATVKEAYSEDNGGYVFKLETSGYASGFIIMCGIDASGTVSGATCLASGETLGYEKTFGEALKGKDLSNVNDVNTVSGATKTTGAYRSAVRDALNAFALLNGKEADTRTEEEILSDNLNNALSTEKVEFTESYANVFIANNAIDMCYVANNGSGFVYVVDKTFIGVDANGNILQSDLSSEVKAKVEAAITAINATEKLDLTQYSDLAREIKDVRRNGDGTLIFELHARGYGINGGDQYHPASGKPIVICLSMSDSGSIIECRTMAQAESKGYGATCGEESYYSQYDGKTKDNYESVDTITGATMTNNAYKKAILRAFEAAEIIKGGN